MDSDGAVLCVGEFGHMQRSNENVTDDETEHELRIVFEPGT